MTQLAQGRPHDLKTSVTEPLFVRLRTETQALHTEVEAMVSILAPSVTVDDYRDFLTTLWGFHRPIERRLANVAGLAAVLPDIGRRWKSKLLESDLGSLGISAEELRRLPVCGRLPELTSVDRAIGALYVVEGSTLGGQHIYRHLTAVLPSVLGDASRFLTCYGADTGRMWKAFREHVLRGSSSLEANEVVKAACETFSAVKEWFSQSQAKHVLSTR